MTPIQTNPPRLLASTMHEQPADIRRMISSVSHFSAMYSHARALELLIAERENQLAFAICCTESPETKAFDFPNCVGKLHLTFENVHFQQLMAARFTLDFIKSRPEWPECVAKCEAVLEQIHTYHADHQRATREAEAQRADATRRIESAKREAAAAAIQKVEESKEATKARQEIADAEARLVELDENAAAARRTLGVISAK